MTTLTNLLTAGDTLSFTTSVPDYPASAGWTLKYRLAPRAGGTVISITASANGDDFDVVVVAATTLAWTAGYYTWAAYVELGSERYTVDRGQLQIRAASSTLAASTDERTHARKVLDAIEALIEGRSDVAEYTIGNRSIKKMSLPDLLKWRSFYKNEVAGEEAAQRLANGLAPGGRVMVRF